jgi:membrane-bound lytic murein transglycosylase F
LSGCFDGNRIRNWSNIQNNGVLRVLTTNTANTYFKGKDDQVEGFEYELSKNFAKQHNLKIEFTIKDSIDDIIQALKNGEGDIAAAGLTITDKRLNFFSFSPSYLDVKYFLRRKP